MGEEDKADGYGGQDHVKPEAPEAELDLPEDLNLDGMEEEGEQKEEESG